MANPSEIPPKELRDLFDPTMWREVAGALGLSPRELEVARAVFHDLSRKQMAKQLKLHPSTIHTYLERVYRKAGVKDEVALVEHLIGVAMAAQGRKAAKKTGKSS